MSNPVYILHIETSNEVCSVALTQNELLLSIRESAEKNRHGRDINSFIQSVMDESGISFKQLNAISVSSGPGSYTGLRIGVSAAKGFAMALDIPLISVSTLQSLCSALKEKHTDGNCFASFIHAREKEFYFSLMDLSGNMPLQNEVINLNGGFLKTLTGFGPVYYSCSDSLLLNEFLRDPLFTFDPSVVPAALHLVHHAFIKYSNKEFEEVAAFEPAYIKPAFVR